MKFDIRKIENDFWNFVKRYSVLISIFLFFMFVIMLEGNGWIIHKLHYDMGANWTPAILTLDNTIKFILYQLVVWTLLLFHKNFWLFAGTQVFCLTHSQDLFFYGWGGFIFPSGDWTWMPLYSVFGTWTTLMQFSVSFGALLFAVLSINILRNKRAASNDKWRKATSLGLAIAHRC